MPQRILLIDDNLAVQKLIELTLRKEGLEVIPVDNALSALDLAFKSTPDLILADFNLEGMSIFSFVEKLRKKPRLAETPIILLINSTETYNPGQLQSAGIQSFLKKPIDSKELTRQVKIQTGTSETMMVDLNTLPQQGETSLSEHFSNPGSDSVSIEELLGWSSPGSMAPPATTEPIRMDQTASSIPSIPSAEVSPSQEEREENISDSMEETQYFKSPPLKEAAKPVSAAPPSIDPMPWRLSVQDEMEAKKPKERPVSAFSAPDPSPLTSASTALSDSTDIEKEMREGVSEAVERVVWEILPSVIESALTKEAITAIIEKVVREVVPPLAEIEIKKEIQRLQTE